jgi:hypothetical protein
LRVRLEHFPHCLAARHPLLLFTRYGVALQRIVYAKEYIYLTPNVKYKSQILRFALAQLDPWSKRSLLVFLGDKNVYAEGVIGIFECKTQGPADSPARHLLAFETKTFGPLISMYNSTAV